MKRRMIAVALLLAVMMSLVACDGDDKDNSKRAQQKQVVCYPEGILFDWIVCIEQ